MNNLLAIHVRAKSDGHGDLSVKLAGFPDLVLDSYYFSLAVESSNSVSSVSDALATLLTCWLTAIGKAVPRQSVYLPIDFSDQYIGCFKVTNLGDSLFLAYGFSRQEGWSVNPINLGDYCATVADFQQDSELVELPKASLLLSIQQQVDSLKKPAS